jgi:1-acylglycerone phosphate reductase
MKANLAAGAYASAKAAVARMSEIMRLELEPLGVRVVTALLGSVDTPIFGKPGGQMKLPKTSYYYEIQENAYRQRMAHQGESMKVEPFAKELVNDILSGNRGPIWHGSFAALVRFATWACPQWYIDKSSNSDRGIELVKRL